MGGPRYKPSSAISFLVKCQNQQEIDRYWDAFATHGGTVVQCGWLTDTYGFVWQIIPKGLSALMSDPDKAKVA